MACDFRQLAIANSADQTALQGGDLGWRKMAQLPGVFIEAVEGSGSRPDICADPQRCAGYHLLKLYGRRGGGEQLIEQHFARHILIKPNQIRDQATASISSTNCADASASKPARTFAHLAKEFSEDPGSALNGGELGWSTPGMFVPEFEQTMSSIAARRGQRALLAHNLAGTYCRSQSVASRTFSEDITRNRAAEYLLRQRKYEEELQVWLQEIRDEAFVEIKESASHMIPEAGADAGRTLRCWSLTC